MRKVKIRYGIKVENEYEIQIVESINDRWTSGTLDLMVY